MKIVFPLLALLVSLNLSAQVSGKIQEDNRSLLTTTDFTVKSNLSGVMYFNIAVNIEGEVTTATLVREKSTIKSTPNMIKAKNLVMKLRFEKGTYYPKFHQGEVKLTFIEKD